jgi:predicted ATPase
MAEVYRGVDTRLNRPVAIKVLPELVSQKPELRARLEMEARAISKLSHPNICTLYDIGHAEGVDYLVFEFLEGKTLRGELAAGALPMRRVISLAAQMADGLAKAHEEGVVHRDLKPENLMVVGETVKILDFGLAKLAETLEAEGETDDDAPTVELKTEAGTVMGTVAYMSPEQLGARRLDFRSDQFSLGLVLYEMATGKRPFRGKTHAQMLMALVRDEPEPLAELAPNAPQPFCWVVERCLAKAAEDRYAATRDLARDLQAIRDRVADLQIARPGARGASHLPTPRNELVGREKELAELRELLGRREVRLVTVTGPGGIGKSRLALEVARGSAEEFSGGVYFVALSHVEDAEGVAPAIAQALGVRERAGETPVDGVKEFLRTAGGPVLLLVDNFEQVTAAAPLLGELLSAAGSLKLLVTSRAALRIYDEREFAVPPLGLPDPRRELPDADELEKCAAIALFVRRATAVRPDFRLSGENSAAVAEICARLDGLPLAIELAAARVKLLPPAAMLTRLASRLQLLTGGARDLPERQQTLRQAIDWSYELLDAAEQRLFRRLGVFAGGCTLDAVEAVCDAQMDLQMDVLDGMSSMVDKSLARQTEHGDGEPRFVMLETLREYAMEKLAENNEEIATRKAHAAYCLVLAEEGAAEEQGAQAVKWMQRFELEHDNFRAALLWLEQSGNTEWGLRLGTALFRFWEGREYLTEGREHLGKLLKMGGAAAPGVRMRALFAAGVLAWEQGDRATSEMMVRESLDIAREIGDERSMAVSLNALAVTAQDAGELEAARGHQEEALRLWRNLGERVSVARALSNLGNVAKLQGEFARARELYRESLGIFEEVGDATGVAWTRNQEGDTAREQGDQAGARMLYEQSLSAFRKLGDHFGIAGTLADLGNLACEQEKFAEADALYRESAGMFQALENKRGVARVLEAFACSAAARGEAERALRLAGAATALRQSIGAPLRAVEQARLERRLEPARVAAGVAQGRMAWLEGWVMPAEEALGEAMG